MSRVQVANPARRVLQLPFHVECPAAMFSVTGVLQLAVT